jgi:hypothetical protein
MSVESKEPITQPSLMVVVAVVGVTGGVDMVFNTMDILIFIMLQAV